MAVKAGTAWIDVEPNLSPFNKATSAFFSKGNPRFGKFGKAMAVGIGAGLAGGVAAGKALYDIGAEFDDASDKIRVRTAATGKRLQKLEKDFKSVVQTVPADFDSASTAIADLNARLDVSGKPLRRLSKQFLELSRITETDVGGNIKTVTRAFGDWDVAQRKQAKTLDFFFRASQMSGASVEELSSQVVQFGAPLRQVGFSLETATAMFAQFEKAGVNTQTMMPGLKFALKSFLAEGRDPAKALAKTFEDIRDGTVDSSDALEIFGQRAGADMVEAIRQGRFDLDDFTRRISRGGDTILKAGKDTQDFAEQWQMFRNRVLVWLEPVAKRVFGAVGDSMQRISNILTDKKLTSEEKFTKVADMVGDAFENAVPKVAQAAEDAAPRVVRGFFDGWRASPLWAKLLTAAFLTSKMRGAGSAAGAALGGSIAASAGTTATTALPGRFGALKGRMRGVGKGILGVGLMMGVADAVTVDGQGWSLGDRFQRLASTVSLGLLPGPSEMDERLATISQRIRDWRGPSLALSDPNRPDASLIREDDLGDFTGRQKQMLQGMARLRNSANRMFGPGTRMIDQAWTNPAKATKDLKTLQNGFAFLRRGAGTSMKDINKVTQRNMRIIRNTLGKDTEAGRKAASENLKATAKAFRVHMQGSGKWTKEAMQTHRRLIRRADLRSPTREKAEQFGKAWAKGMKDAKGSTTRGVKELIREANKMPAPMRKVALQTWNHQITAAVKAGKVTKAEAKAMRSKVGAEFQGINLNARTKSKKMSDGVINSFEQMVRTSSRGLGILGDNTNSLLTGFDVGKVKFKLKQFKPDRKQRGGPINTGAPVGDSVPALLERGEYVLNRRAVEKAGKAALDRLNFGEAPRFQVGGGVGTVTRPYPNLSGDTDFLPALGFALSKLAKATVGNISVTSGGRSNAEQQALWNANPNPMMVARPDTSNHESGLAADISPQKPSYGGREGAFGLGFPMSWEPWHIELMNALGGAKGAGAAMAPKLKRIILEGSEGPLKDLGQAALDKVRTAGQKFLNQQTTFSGAGGGGPWRGVLNRIAGARGWDAGAWLELVMRESGGDPRAENPTSGAAGLAQALPPSKYPPGAWPYVGPESAVKQIQWMASYISGRYGTPTAALGFHSANNWYQRGGPVGMQEGGDPLVKRLGRKMHKTLEAVREQPKKPKRRKRISGLLKKFNGIGLPGPLVKRLSFLENDDLRLEERANRAGQLTTEPVDEDGNPILDADRRPIVNFGVVEGKTEADWLAERMKALVEWRNKLIKARGLAEQAIEQTRKLMAQAIERLSRVQKTIADQGEAKRRFESLREKIRDLVELRAKPKKNAKRIDRLVKLIRSRFKVDVSGESREALRERAGNLGKRIQETSGNQAERVRERDAIKGRVLPNLRDRREKLTTDSAAYLENLNTIQGHGGSMASFSGVPALAQFGGTIFDVGDRMKELAIRPPRVPADSSLGEGSDSERADFLEQELIRERQRDLVDLSQWRTLRQYRLGDRVPFAGTFHEGGVVPGPRGAERMALVQAGERITPEDAVGATPVVQVIIDKDAGVDPKKVRQVVLHELRGSTRGGRRVMGGV